jgi:outer membrane biosynthesis protein TonB
MSSPSPAPRHGLATITFAIVLLGAVLAVFPATAPLGLLLCLVAIVPAIVAFVRARRGRPHRRRALAALVLAPVFLVVAAGVTSTLPRPAPAATPTVGTVNAAVAAPARSTTVAAVPTTDPTVVAAAPLAAAAPAAGAAPVQQPPAATTTARVAPQPVAAPAKKSAPAAVAAPVQAKAAAPAPAKVAAPKAPAPAKEKAAAPAPSGGATAVCNDGTTSTSQHRSGTCSHHGGVAKFLVPLP